MSCDALAVRGFGFGSKARAEHPPQRDFLVETLCQRAAFVGVGARETTCPHEPSMQSTPSAEATVLLSTAASLLAKPAASAAHGPLMAALMAKKQSTQAPPLRVCDPLDKSKSMESVDAIHCTLPAADPPTKARTRLARALRESVCFRIVHASHAALLADSTFAPLLLTCADSFFIVPAEPRFEGEVLCCGGGGERARAVRESCCAAVMARAKAAKVAGEPHCKLARDPTRLAELVSAETPAARLQHLFSRTPAELRAQLQLDADARFLVTDEAAADTITDTISGLEGVGRATVILDATACIGGNTLSFAKRFETVVAIENDAARFGMLTQNCAVLAGAGGRGKIKLRHADCLLTVPKLAKALQSKAAKVAAAAASGAGAKKRQRATARNGEFVVFLDPPWGGLAYKEVGAKSALCLSGTPLPRVAREFLSLPGCVACALKVPTAYDESALPRASSVLSLNKAAKCIILTPDALSVSATPSEPAASQSAASQPAAADDDAAMSKSKRKQKRKRAEAVEAEEQLGKPVGKVAGSEGGGALDDIFGGLSSAKRAAKERADEAAAAEAASAAARAAVRDDERAQRKNIVRDPIFGEEYDANAAIDPNNARVHRLDSRSGLNVYKAHHLGLGHGGGTPLCPFDCNCCF